MWLNDINHGFLMVFKKRIIKNIDFWLKFDKMVKVHLKRAQKSEKMRKNKVLSNLFIFGLQLLIKVKN